MTDSDFDMAGLVRLGSRWTLEGVTGGRAEQSREHQERG